MAPYTYIVSDNKFVDNSGKSFSPTARFTTNAVAVHVVLNENGKLAREPFADFSSKIKERQFDAGDFTAFAEAAYADPQTRAATGRQLIAAAKALPSMNVQALLEFKRDNLELDASWSADGLMRRSGEEFVQSEQALGEAFGGGQAQGAAMLDALFMEAQNH